MRCGVGRMADIGVGKQQVIRRKTQPVDSRNALRLRPHLARPAGRQGCGRQHGQAVFETAVARSGLSGVGGAVCAVVVDDDQMKRTRVILREQRRDRAADHIGFIARRHDRDHGRPRATTRDLRLADSVNGTFAEPPGGLRTPETAAAKQQDKPDKEGQPGNQEHRQFGLSRFKINRRGTKSAYDGAQLHAQPATQPHSQRTYAAHPGRKCWIGATTRDAINSCRALSENPLENRSGWINATSTQLGSGFIFAFASASV